MALPLILFDSLNLWVGNLPHSSNAVLNEQDAWEHETDANSAPEADTEHLREALNKLSDQASNLGVDLVDVAGVIQNVTEMSQRHVSLFNDVTQTADTISKSNKKVSALAHQTDIDAKEARTLLQASSNSVDTSIGQIENLHTISQEMNTDLSSFSKALEDVDVIAEQIGSIARQTNLLSINAAIEAARAGEAGKGFAVVAGEVRSLSQQASSATATIQSALDEIKTAAKTLVTTGENCLSTSVEMKVSSEKMSQSFQQMGGTITQVLDNASIISEITEQSEIRYSGFVKTLSEVSSEVEASSQDLDVSSQRIDALVALSERIIQLTASAGVETSDTILIDKIRLLADEVSLRFETAIDNNEISTGDLFSQNYDPIENTDPQQYRTSFLTFTDRILPQFQERALEFSELVAFCAAVDLNGFLPTHNKKFSQAQRFGEPEWNTANCRNRRLFNDRVGLGAGQNTEPFLVQTYRRDMGGGKFALMKDISAPIIVNGRHWGGLRLGVQA